MVTKQQALVHKHFTHIMGKKPFKVRASGKCRTWKTRPLEFVLPVKFGLYESGYIDQDNANEWYVEGHEGLTDEESQVKTDQYLELTHK